MGRNACGRTVLLALVLALSTLLAGCGVPFDSPAPSRELVLALVADSCPNEGYELVREERVRELPEKVVYTFRSTERALTFTTTSEVTEPTYGLLPQGPHPTISCDYATTVMSLHYDDVVAELAEIAEQREEGPLVMPASGDIYVTDYAQIEEAVALLERVDAVYDPELAYNDPAWVRRNASTLVHVRWFDGRMSAEDGRPEDWENLGDIGLYGELDGEEAIDELASAYGRLVTDGIVPEDDALPPRFR